MKKKPLTRMSADELAAATSQFDAPAVSKDPFVPLDRAGRKWWKSVAQRRGRPAKSDDEKAVRVLISLQPDLLAAAHRHARRTGNTLSGLVAQQLKSVVNKRRKPA